MRKETIAAISTGMTNSGIGIVRISGEEAVLVVDRIYRGKKKLCEVKSHTINYGYIVDREISSAEKKSEEVIDEVLVTVMKAPGTFTGEDTVEINCHGGTFVVKKVLELVLKNGASPAEPGEFTKRAFLNGKMDLSQAEAVIDVINSENEYALQSSVSQLKGSVKKKINDIREKIIYHTAFIETALDDPEHISVDGYSDTLRSSAEEIIQELERLIHSADDGRVIKEGIKTVIVGKPNAGKSSLLNVLAGHERAIVTDIEGTTRDVLEETIKLGVLNLNVVDTAGIRQTEDLIEKIGVDKALEYAETADLIIYVVDASRSLDENDEKIINMISDKKSIVLLNKSDIDTVISAEHIKEKVSNIPIISISAKEERGIKDLEDKVKEMFLKGDISFNDQVYISNVRQKNALLEALESMKKVIRSIDDNMPEDFYSIDLMDAYESLGYITGNSVGEDLINEIFSKFCMGK
ncbi:tRNA uridine-5-carboxymethylaminomethyl(34) synthesis GTPase MnmE [[Ruminococcus] torques]|uniref:tRNA uridine-5-carboxymethylaminomethyl(34) synthesis GTPase MnmE n=2 Tax=[Ruminococcus] torques TaxID=33039 RepID=UPI00265D9637|nr:tRNA uridine-5-carboxymethylaminomethyl(34) synthesis GTPase MnmE [[Ruminococcus] torques]